MFDIDRLNKNIIRSINEYNLNREFNRLKLNNGLNYRHTKLNITFENAHYKNLISKLTFTYNEHETCLTGYFRLSIYFKDRAQIEFIITPMDRTEYFRFINELFVNKNKKYIHLLLKLYKIRLSRDGGIKYFNKWRIPFLPTIILDRLTNKYELKIINNLKDKIDCDFSLIDNYKIFTYGDEVTNPFELDDN